MCQKKKTNIRKSGEVIMLYIRCLSASLKERMEVKGGKDGSEGGKGWKWRGGKNGSEGGKDGSEGIEKWVRNEE